MWARAGTIGWRPSGGASRNRLGGEALDEPAGAGAAVPEAVVGPALAVLPELPHLGHEPVAAPPLRPRHVAVRVLRLALGDAPLQLLPVGEHLALARRMRADPAAVRPRREVLVRFLRRHARDRAFDADLAPEGVPVDEERRARVRLELPALAARVVRVEDEPLLVEALEQHHPQGRLPLARRGRERRRLGRAHDGPRLLEPALELPQRVGVQLAPPQRHLPLVRHGDSSARRSAGRRTRWPSSASPGTRSRTTRRTRIASSLSGLRILLPFRSARPRGAGWTARSRSV